MHYGKDEFFSSKLNGRARLCSARFASVSVSADTLDESFALFRSVAFSPDGSRLVGIARGGTRVWDVRTGRELLSLNSDDFIVSVAFSPDGTQIVSGGWDKTIRIWNAVNAQETHALVGHTGKIKSVAFDPRGKRVVSTSEDGILKLWDLDRPQARTIGQQTRCPRRVAFSPNGKRLISGSRDATIKVWEMTTAREMLTLEPNAGWVNTVAFSSDGKRIAAGMGFPDWALNASRDLDRDMPGLIQVWEGSDRQMPLPLVGHQRASSVAFSPTDARQIVTGGNSIVKVWDLASGRDLRSFEFESVVSVAYSPDGTRIVCAGGKPDTSGEIKVLEVESGSELCTFDRHKQGVTSVAFSPDGKRIASGSFDGSLKVWNAASGRETCELTGHSGVILSVAFSPDGNRIVSGSGGNDNTTKVWNAHSGGKFSRLMGNICGSHMRPLARMEGRSSSPIVSKSNCAMPLAVAGQYRAKTIVKSTLWRTVPRASRF